jgi:signal transduction histidine kinase
MGGTPRLCDDGTVMTTAPSPAPSTVGRAPRRAHRDLEESIVGGVAAGLAEHLGFSVSWIRAGFILTTALSGLGVVLYAGLWMTLPSGNAFVVAAPGIESASRGGRRPGRMSRLGDLGPVLVLSVLGVGAIFSVSAVVGGGAVLWPLTVGVLGVALLWRQADEAQRERWLDATGSINPVRVVLGDGGWASYARLGFGVLLIATSLGLFALRGGSLAMARDVTVAGLLGVVGLGLVAVPWLFRLATELTDERSERMRTQERADVAAHLHDSVLQTLALIQKNATDASAVSRLARSQERDLRAWLYVGESADESSVANALRGVAAEIEDAHGISVDVVTVGDVDLVEELRPIVAATRESLTNAAKHAGVPRVDVYAEIDAAGVEVFVRDRGRGFVLETTPEDRYGVRHSIIDRMQRHGGRAEIRTAPGEGTEVRLRLSVSHTNQHEGAPVE